ncbi:hypothetical protein Dsin_022613 [Dipteronia sinensis]|uniref:ULTRAPETALA1/2 zinc finger domain-containing protein n=1 Tax=Dipteronia sinensis TaxID=43782 RepID=A0AAE0A1Q1_9ROSI|nr:hypothetical protein Dsin_022613 [Dipteronia sinensis]
MGPMRSLPAAAANGISTVTSSSPAHCARKSVAFRLRTKEDCMIYHAAAADKKWKCSDRPYDRITCVDDEERHSRKRYRGCPESSSKCEGCNSCVCVGCLKCRSKECDCILCVNFMQNAEP